MRCPTLPELPSPPPGKTGWPWTQESQKLPDKTPDGKPWPKVSIVTPSYNQGRFLEESIRSVLLQGYPDLEYIIIDGGSTDESVEIIKKYEHWLTYWVSEPDRGQSHAINKGLEKSTGQFFNWQNADDMLTPDSLAATAAAIVNHPEAGYIHGYHIAIDTQSNIQYHNQGELKGKGGFVRSFEWIVSNLKAGCQPGCLMNRSLVIEAGMVDEGLHYVMDLDLMLRIAFLKPPFYIDYPVVFYRQYPQTKSSAMEEKALERLIVARKVFSRRDLPRHIYKLKKQSFVTAHRFARKCYISAERYEDALWHLLCEIAHLPLRKWGTKRGLLFRLIKNAIIRMIKRGRRLFKDFSSWKYLLLKVNATKKYSTYLDVQYKRSKRRHKYSGEAVSKRKEELIGLLSERVNLKLIGNALVIGCRDALELDLLESKGVRNVIGIDLFSLDKRIKVMDMHNIKYQDKFFDLVYTSHSLEHGFDYNKVISEILRVIKNDGIIAIEVPVNYETTEVDLHDFKSANNLIKIFSNHANIKEVLYKAELKKEDNFSGADVSRLIMKIEK